MYVLADISPDGRATYYSNGLLGHYFFTFDIEKEVFVLEDASAFISWIGV